MEAGELLVGRMGELLVGRKGEPLVERKEKDGKTKAPYPLRLKIS
jgi:hypothetical protein